MAIERFKDGVATVLADDVLGPLPLPDPTKWAVHMEDFVDYDKAQGDTKWTFTTTNNADTVVGPTGVLVLTNAGADNDLGQLYHTDAAWQTNSKKLLFEARVKVDKGSGGDIAQSEFFVGLSSVQTGADFVAADGLTRTMDDALGFYSPDATANVDCIQGEADTFSTESAATTIVDATWMVLTIYYDGATSRFYKDGTLIATLTSNEPTSVVTPMMFIKAGEAKASTLSVDYFLVAAER